VKDCPGCSFLIGDGEVLCSSCESKRVSTFPLDDLPGAALPAQSTAPTGAAHGATLLLDRPVAPPLDQGPVRFRDPTRVRRTVRSGVILAAVAALLGVLGPMALRGEGPLASTAISFGLAQPPAVVVPDNWTRFTSTPGNYGVSLPSGAVGHFETLVPGAPEAGSFAGYRSDLGEDGQILVLTGDLGLGPAQLAALDEAGFDGLIDHVVATGRFGTETVRRDVALGVGRAKDSVIAGDDEASASRIRFMLVDGRFHMLVTEGPDSGASALDRAHSRLLGGFAPQR
jgi:hypothetical protein